MNFESFRDSHVRYIMSKAVSVISWAFQKVSEDCQRVSEAYWRNPERLRDVTGGYMGVYKRSYRLKIHSRSLLSGV